MDQERGEIEQDGTAEKEEEKEDGFPGHAAEDVGVA